MKGKHHYKLTVTVRDHSLSNNQNHRRLSLLPVPAELMLLYLTHFLFFCKKHFVSCILLFLVYGLHLYVLFLMTTVTHNAMIIFCAREFILRLTGFGGLLQRQKPLRLFIFQITENLQLIKYASNVISAGFSPIKQCTQFPKIILLNHTYHGQKDLQVGMFSNTHQHPLVSVDFSTPESVLELS